MLGTQTRVGWSVSVDESTELWQDPIFSLSSFIFLLLWYPIVITYPHHWLQLKLKERTSVGRVLHSSKWPKFLFPSCCHFSNAFILENLVHKKRPIFDILTQKKLFHEVFSRLIHLRYMLSVSRPQIYNLWCYFIILLIANTDNFVLSIMLTSS